MRQASRLRLRLAAGAASFCLLAVPLFGQARGSWRVIAAEAGQSRDNHFGHALASAGDVDGDGIPDLIIGAPLTQIGSGFVYRPGAAYVASGRSGQVLHHFFGQATVDWFGVSVAGPGDVDADGVPDILAGAPFADPGQRDAAGSAYLFSGRDGSLLFQFDGAAPGDELGSAVAGAGDVNGDGFPDLLVGSPGAEPNGKWNAGSAFVFSGRDGALLWRFDGGLDDSLGHSVAGAGDVDGDGFDDVLIGAPEADPIGFAFAGAVYLHSGATGALLRRFDGQNHDDDFGWSLAAGRDFDGDGTPDVVIGAPSADPGGRNRAGIVYAFSGASGQLLWYAVGSLPGDHLGVSVAIAGDTDGDGVIEVLAGAPGDDENNRKASGTIFLFAGPSGALRHEFHGGRRGDQLGWSCAGAGDLDGDGRDELLLGAPWADRRYLEDRGVAYVADWKP